MSRIPDLVVERVHLGEASDAERARVMADDDARARLEALPAADEAFLAAHPAGDGVATIRRKLHVRRTEDAVSGRSRQARWGLALVPLAVGAVALAIWVPRFTASTGDPGLERTTAKWGQGARLFVYRDATAGAERLVDGAAAAPGDRLQIRYQALDATHGVIASVDGRGSVTLHHPSGSAGSTALEPGGVQDIGFAYELDDAPAYERFFLVSGQEPVSVEAVVEAIEDVAAEGRSRERLALPDTLEQTTLFLRKEVR